MAKKSSRGKVSSIKRRNQRQTKLRKQGKLKTRRHRKKEIAIVKPPAKPPVEEEIDPVEEEKLKRQEEEDLEYLKSNFSENSYSFLAGADLEKDGQSTKRKRKLRDNDLYPAEVKYEQSGQLQDAKKVKFLLPIKTKEGLVTRTMEIDEERETEMETDEKEVKVEEEKEGGEKDETQTKEYSSADLLARRENSLRAKKFRIGILCSGLLESPETKIKNFKPLIEMLGENDPAVCVTVKKLALVSLLEIFKDILPEYQIKIHDDPKVKLKKQVKLLRDYESDLLRYYKLYLQKIEGMVSVLKRKRGAGKAVEATEMSLVTVAVKCLCELLASHPYFNFSKNIVHLLIPFLDSGVEGVRTMISATVKDVFKKDKRGEVSLYIVRGISKFAKSRNNAVRPDVVRVFLSLKLEDVNLDREKEEEMRKKKMTSRKFNIMSLSKRERKRKKRLKDLEKELLETKASESKDRKREHMTEITKLVFVTYFRILKLTPSSKLLNAALEGLSKFAHCINVEFYHDLVNVLDRLIEKENLGFKEKLCCVHTVFTILFYQGATIYLDPTRFYAHLYASIVHLNAGKSHEDVPLVLRAVDVVLLKRRKYISLQRLLAFAKRLTSVALQLLPNASLAFLNVIKEILQVNNSTDILLDVDASIGDGIYLPELDEPEYCNAGMSSLWELLPLQRHYHPTVADYAKTIADTDYATKTRQSRYKSYMSLTSQELFDKYDASQVKFNPPVPTPRKFPKKKKTTTTTTTRRTLLMSDELEDYVKSVVTEDEFKNLTE